MDKFVEILVGELPPAGNPVLSVEGCVNGIPDEEKGEDDKKDAEVVTEVKPVLSEGGEAVTVKADEDTGTTKTDTPDATVKADGGGEAVVTEDRTDGGATAVKVQADGANQEGTGEPVKEAETKAPKPLDFTK